MKGRNQQLLIFSVAMTLIFGVLMTWSHFSGAPIVSVEVPERVFGQEQVKTPPIRFTQDKDGPLTMKITGSTLNNSWVWVKTVILDTEDIAIQEHDFDLSYYHGPDWSEGNRSDDWIFRLPAGEYRVLVYGESEQTQRNGPRDIYGDKLEVEIKSGVVLTRYFLLGFILFLLLSLRANKLASDARENERAAQFRQDFLA